MKKNLFLFIALCALVFFHACNHNDPADDPCDGIDCIHGTCVDGVCNCDPGYALDTNGRCTMVLQSSFLHTYSVLEVCTSSEPTSYLATITAGSTSTEVRISNFWYTFTNNVTANISGATLTIPRQEPDGDDFFVEGTGTYSVNAAGKAVITFNYKVTDEHLPTIYTENCNYSIYTEQ